MSGEDQNPEELPLQRCLFCFEEIPQAAKKCRFCGEWQKPDSSRPSSVKGLWEKVEIAGRVLSFLLIPIVLALLANSVNKALKKSDVDLHMVELSVGILKEEPRDENTELRKWAIDVIDRHAEVPFSQEAKDELLERPLPRNVFFRRNMSFADLTSDVTIRTVNANGDEVHGYKIMYSLVWSLDDESSMYSTFPILSSPVTARLPIGNYLIWWQKGSKQGPKRPFRITSSTEIFELNVDTE